LHLTVAPAADQAREVAGTVMARVASCGGEVGAVILTLEGNPHPSSMPCEELCALGRRLQQSRIRLYLVISARDARQNIERYRPEDMESPLAVHPTLRSAVLASYAALPGPGLVTAAIRAALITPAEPLESRPQDRPGTDESQPHRAHPIKRRVQAGLVIGQHRDGRLNLRRHVGRRLAGRRANGPTTLVL
jgi:hypothetical protein